MAAKVGQVISVSLLRDEEVFQAAYQGVTPPLVLAHLD
jgi:hypothetical protein